MQGREIKFRIWDFENQEMIDGDSLAFEEYAPIKHLLSRKGIMQFTGLCDKNGKEIYEGDVVRVKNGAAVEEAPEYIRAEIIWGEGYFDFNHKHIPEFDSDDYSTYYFIYPPFSYKAEELEVIGNIYENPELLEVEK